jgi:anti-anti-sigma factor
VHGPLAADTAPELHDRLVDLVDGQGNRRLVLELRDMTSIDRAGIAVMVDALKRLQRNAGTLVLSGPTAETLKALDAAGVAKAFAITRAWAHPAYGDGQDDHSLPAGRRRIG